jgi:hypothetical protein
VTPLLAAIESKYQEATAITASGPWLDVAADTATYPFGVYQIIGMGGHEPYYDATYDDVVNIRFTLYIAGSASTATTAQTALHTRFDKVKLTLSSGRNYHTLRTGQMLRWTGTTDKNGEKVYQTVSEYRFKVNKPY